MPSASDDVRDRMRADWDARASENAYHYVASGRETWTLEEFLESGRRSVQSLVLDDLSRICGGRNPRDLRTLEIGCGAGRMTAALADVFGEVHAVDVSAVMLERAREHLANRSNVELHLCDGASLAALGDLEFDFILSYIVFQHIPDRHIVEGYIRDAADRLRPSGVLKFQVQGAEEDRSDRLDTWRGAYFGAADAVRVAAQSCCRIAAFEGLGEQYFWLWFRKTLAPNAPDPSCELLLAELERRREHRHSLEDELIVRTAWAQSLDERIQESNRAILRLQGEVETSNSWALGLDTENRTLRGLVDERTAWAQERDRQVLASDKEVQRLQGEIDDRTAWARSLEAQVEERTAWARRLEAELDQHRRWLSSIEQSFVYRLAARLRLVPTR